MKPALIFCLLEVALAPAIGAEGATSAVAKAAARFAPAVKWKASSAIADEFTCDGRKQYAIIGTEGQFIYLAIFTRDLHSKPTSLKFSLARREVASLRIKTESLNFDPRSAGAKGDISEGMKPSKTCKGIDLEDDETDSAHIYWNRERQRFEAWSQ